MENITEKIGPPDYESMWRDLTKAYRAADAPSTLSIDEIRDHMTQIERQHWYPKDPDWQTVAEKFAKLAAEMKPCPPEFAKIINEHFWELLA